MKSLSIRARIQLWFASLCALLLLIFAVVVSVYHSRTTTDSLDERLALRAEALIARCEIEDERFVCEVDATTQPQFAGEHPHRAFLVQTVPDLTVVALGGGLSVLDMAPDDRQTWSPAQRLSTRSFGSAFRLLETVRPYEGGEHGENVMLRIVTAEDTTDLQSAHSKLLLALATGAIAALLAAIAAGWFLAGRIVDPLARMAAGAESVQAGRPGALVRSGNGDEIDQLGSTLERAFGRLQDALARQVRFTADASHELRTPLAIMRTQAEVALHRPREADGYREALGEVLTGAHRMTDILESLLVLARADGGTLDCLEQDLDLCTLAGDAARTHAAAAATQQVTLQVDGQPGTTVRGDPRLLAILLDNLISNAIRYRDGPGAVVVQVRRTNAGPSLAVVDDGIGIAPDRIEHIFERFFRVDADRSRRAGGSGLGLSIVRAIAERHGATCRVESVTGKGTRVEVAFAASPASHPMPNSEPRRGQRANTRFP
ncbi:MAG: HAMP domain-containing sensor histidine kinase [Planctomycetota bacterium]